MCILAKVNKEIAERIESIEWFSKCGTPVTGVNIAPKIIQVKDWEQAQQWCSDLNWEKKTLEARNLLTEFLHNKYPNRYLEWNETVRRAKDYLESSISSYLENYKKQNNLSSLFVDCVKWDLLNAIMEYDYKDCRGRPIFFIELLLIYENGHFPCGWNGKQLINGELVIY